MAGLLPRPARPVPGLRTGPDLPRAAQGQRPLPVLRRGAASSSRRRRAGLFQHRPSSVTSSCRWCSSVETAFAPPYWVHAALWLPLTLVLAFALDASDQGRDRRLAMGNPHARLRSRRAAGRRSTSPPLDASQERTAMTDHDFCQADEAVERDRTSPNVRPKDASTLIIVDRSGTSAEGAARQAPSRRTNSCRANSCFPAAVSSRTTG